MKEQPEEFPYDQFPWKLTFKDGKEIRKCFFQSEDHMKKHIQRSKLKKNQFTAQYKFAK